MRRMKAAPACATLNYVSLLSCSRIISRFGQQARPGERVDSGLTAFRLSEFATLDKIRLSYKTRLGRFITSPRLACRPPLIPAVTTISIPHFGDRHHAAWGQTPKSVLKNLVIQIFFAVIVKMVKLRIQCGTFLSLFCFA